MVFYEKLKSLRLKNGFIQKEVAKKLGIDRTTYNKYETGKSEPDHSVLCELSELYGVSIDYLLGTATANQSILTSDEQSVIDLYNNANIQAKKSAVSVLELGQTKRAMQKHDSETADETLDNVFVPVVGRSAAGIPIEMIENYDDPLKISDPRIKPGDFAVIASGDSMIEAGISDGDRVIVRPCSAVDNGAIALVAVNGGSTIKRFYKTDEGYKLVPANSAYEAMEYTKGANIRVLGRFIKVVEADHDTQ